jgi:hypothetical protein
MANDDPNPYYRDPPTAPETAASAGVEEIGTAACWKLVEANSLGRLAIQNIDGRPDLFPLNYLVHEGSVFMKSAPGAKLRSLPGHPDVALEIDGVDGAFQWSIVIRGSATRMGTDADIEASGILTLASDSPTAKHNYLRLVPDTVTGRRFPVRNASPHRMNARSASTSRRHEPDERVDQGVPGARTADKPQPIPHLPPWGG